jgi:hypothetical protein
VLLSKVSELLDPVTGSWDTELIKDIFWEEDVVNILAIPTRVDRDDVVAWHFDPRGIFSVKSAYHVLDDGEEQNKQWQKGEFQTSGEIQRPTMYGRKFGGFHIHQGSSSSCARVTHNSLPLKMKIKRRGIDLDTRCPVCLRLDEDGGHCFVKCKYVRQCWRVLQLEDVRLSLIKMRSSREFIQAILNLQPNT